MPASWKNSKKLKPEVVIEKIKGAIIEIKKDTVSFKAYEIEDARTALSSMIDFGPGISRFTRTQILSKSISNAIRAGELTKSTLLTDINEKLKNHFDQKETEYHLLTSISLSQPYPLKSISIKECTITLLTGDFPKKYQSRKLSESEWDGPKDHTPISYCKVIIKTKSKTIYEAADEALDALDILRSSICLFNNSLMALAWGSNAHDPINTVTLGGLHTLHYKSGGRTKSSVWYEPNYSQRRPLRIRDNALSITAGNIKWLIKKSSESPYQKKIFESMLRYVRAFDEKDRNTVILKAWGALEGLTASGENNYDLVTRRCSFLFEDRNYHHQIIEHLREYRNSTIHNGDYSNDAQVHCHQLQQYIFHLIVFHARNSEFFKTLEEANSFLDLPSDQEKLKRKRELIEKAIKFTLPTNTENLGE